MADRPSGKVRLDNAAVRTIQARLAAGETVRAIAAGYPVSHQTIHNIKTGKRRKRSNDMPKTYTETITLQELTCSNCGITFAVPQHWLESKRSTGDAFSCPNGHGQCYSKGREVLLREELTAEQNRSRELALQLTSTKDQLQATKKELQQHKTRTANGVCPCCHRAFAQLHRHMQTRHPEYAS